MQWDVISKDSLEQDINYPISNSIQNELNCIPDLFQEINRDFKSLQSILDSKSLEYIFFKINTIKNAFISIKYHFDDSISRDEEKPIFESYSIIPGINYDIVNDNTIYFSNIKTDHFNDIMTITITLNGKNFKKGISVQYQIPDNEQFLDNNPIIISEFKMISILSLQILELSLISRLLITIHYDDVGVKQYHTLNIKIN